MELTLSSIPEKEALRYLGVRGEAPADVLAQASRISARVGEVSPARRMRLSASMPSVTAKTTARSQSRKRVGRSSPTSRGARSALSMSRQT